MEAFVMEARHKAFYWLDEKRISVQITFDKDKKETIEEAFVSWERSASGYNPKDEKRILIFTKTVDKSEEIVDIIKGLENKSFLIEEVT